MGTQTTFADYMHLPKAVNAKFQALGRFTQPPPGDLNDLHQKVGNRQFLFNRWKWIGIRRNNRDERTPIPRTDPHDAE